MRMGGSRTSATVNASDGPAGSVVCIYESRSPIRPEPRRGTPDPSTRTAAPAGELDDIPTSRYDPRMSESDSPRGLDLDRLRRHLDRRRPGLTGGELRATLIQGGRSNLTYRVTDG